MPRVRKPSPRNFSSPQLCGGKRIYRSQREAEIVKEEQELLQHDSLSLSTAALQAVAAGTSRAVRTSHRLTCRYDKSLLY